MNILNCLSFCFHKTQQTFKLMSCNHDKGQMYFPLKNELSFKGSSRCIKVSLLIKPAVNICV